MHLFLVDLFISIDVLSPIIYQLGDKKAIICNINPIQDHRQNKLIKYLLKKKIKYFDFIPVDPKKKFHFLLTKIVLLLPCFILKRLRGFIKKIYANNNFTSEKEMEKFLLDNNIKSITYEESAPENYISLFYEVAKKLKIKMVRVTSGIGVIKDISVVNESKMKFCDKILLPNKMYIIDKDFVNKTEIVGSLRYTTGWFKILNKIQGGTRPNKKKIVLGFFKKFYSKEKNIVDNLIKKLKKHKKFDIITREKPRDIFPLKCNIFEEDSFTSSQLIDFSQFIITARPSSILAEALIKNKKILLLYYANSEIYNTPFSKSKAFFKIEKESDVMRILNKKSSIKKNYKHQFLSQVLHNWNKPNIIKNKISSFYNAIK